MYKTASERKKQSEEKLAKLGISYTKSLPVIEDSHNVTLKPIDEIAKRAIACLITIQVACDMAQGNNAEDSKKYFTEMLERFNATNALTTDEQYIFEDGDNERAQINMSWRYEPYWVLAWVLGFVEKLEYPNQTCDFELATKFVAIAKDYEDFISKCKLRDIEEILDEIDLEYRYHWACVEKEIEPDLINIKDLSPDVVVERRRALEWIISPDGEDWDTISLDT